MGVCSRLVGLREIEPNWGLNSQIECETFYILNLESLSAKLGIKLQRRARLSKFGNWKVCVLTWSSSSKKRAGFSIF